MFGTTVDQWRVHYSRLELDPKIFPTRKSVTGNAASTVKINLMEPMRNVIYLPFPSKSTTLRDYCYPIVQNMSGLINFKIIRNDISPW